MAAQFFAKRMFRNYAYYSSLLNGRGMVTEYRKSLVYSKIVYTVVALSMLFMNFGLISIVVANLLTPFVVRLFSHRYFFNKDLINSLENYTATKKEKVELLSIIWHNAKKLGLVYLGSFAITKIGMFIAGLYLSLNDVASYGLMVQLVSLIAVVSTTINTLYQPRISSLRILNLKNDLLKEFSYTVVIFKILFLIGSLLIVLLGNEMLVLLGSDTILPNNLIVLLYCLVVFLETNHSLFSSFLVTNNEIPFVIATLVAGGIITLLSYVFLKFFDFGLISIIIVPLFVQLAYNNWKWPYEICKFFKISYYEFNRVGFLNLISQLKLLIKRS
jgi:O-antigen/teichoic acid export membrane protein